MEHYSNLKEDWQAMVIHCWIVWQILSGIRGMNLSFQGKQLMVFSASDKIPSFKQKLDGILRPECLRITVLKDIQYSNLQTWTDTAYCLAVRHPSFRILLHNHDRWWEWVSHYTRKGKNLPHNLKCIYFSYSKLLCPDVLPGIHTGVLYIDSHYVLKE